MRQVELLEVTAMWSLKPAKPWIVKCRCSDLLLPCVQAVEYVQSGMVLGLGTGSTAAFAVAKIGELLKVSDLLATTFEFLSYDWHKLLKLSTQEKVSTGVVVYDVWFACQTLTIKWSYQCVATFFGLQDGTLKDIVGVPTSKVGIITLWPMVSESLGLTDKHPLLVIG